MGVNICSQVVSWFFKKITFVSVLKIQLLSLPGVCVGWKHWTAFVALLLSSICPPVSSPIFLPPPFFLPEESLSNALNYTHHWFTERRIGTERDACCFFSPPSSSCFFFPLLLQELPVNKNRQANEGQQAHCSTRRFRFDWQPRGFVLCEGCVRRLIASERPPGSQMLHEAEKEKEAGRRPCAMESVFPVYVQVVLP